MLEKSKSFVIGTFAITLGAIVAYMIGTYVYNEAASWIPHPYFLFWVGVALGLFVSHIWHSLD